ncbi:hypothetical protein ACTQV0_08220 [Selenomonas montiformis]|uniref:hypothetical protein n=1 Tax=Selenomonas montiformis TaxID=2652285 RepID=UPI003F8AA6E8
MIYAFDGIIAKEVGVSAAIVFHHIAYWVQFNEVHEQNFINGKYWMYDTIANMQKFLNFYTDRTIKNSISKLVENGYLVRDELNQDKYNHTKWYALTEKGMAYANLNNTQKGQFDREKSSQSRKGKNFPIGDKKSSQSTIKQNNTNKGIQQSNTTVDPFCTGSPSLNDALRGFDEMRKKLHKPLTARAKELIVKKLEKLAPGDEESQIAILDQSVERGWQGVFPLHADAAWQGRDSVGKSRLSGGAGKDKSPYAAYFDGDAPKT